MEAAVLDIQADNLPILPTLLYHKVTPEWEPGISAVDPKRFRKQMLHLKQNGWRTVLPSEFYSEARKRLPNDIKPFVLCFDDGYDNIHKYAFPILNEVGFQAVLFIPTYWIGKYNDWDHQLFGVKFKHLNLTQITDLSNAGWEIGSHTVRHVPLNQVNDETLLSELRDSKEFLENALRKRIEWLSFPFGRWDLRAVACALQTKYAGAVALPNALLNHGNVHEQLRLLENMPKGLHFRQNRFTLLIASSVYQFDNPESVLRLVNNPNHLGLLRRIVKWCSGATIIWNKIFKRGINH